VAPIIAHGFATAGFLSWGDVALHWVKMRRLRAAQVSSQEAAPPADQ
jgi:hypothetical protein